MAGTGRNGNHRSKKKRITLALAPIAALGMAVTLMYSAGAATPDEVAADCRTDSDKLENCEFIDVQFKNNNLGPNERVTSVSDNCASTSAATKSFSGTASATRVIQLEDGFTVDANVSLAGDILALGAKFNTSEINIKRDDTTASFSFTRSDTVKPDHIAYFMWSHKRTDVSGYLRATYKEAQDGQKVFFSPSEGGTSVHVFYPQLLSSGIPDGRLWLRNVKCETPQANTPQDNENAVGAEPGFGEGGENVTDVEIPLTEIDSK
ncbi:hypothetical protein [Streptomyces ipomoeae]|uniref:hypothetical protein n=1 Tax=Streptomyces ipomoeae TaxID=103232 RepID=UPI001146F85E|nr:hypothetical protein [Streptomyces ipomoeae]MDX2939132.1 hypothetical protein [Streptomyces ipomoeae]TQE30395.1 hypothetical protein SipoB123_04435 [Streptomyces ipomoeae]